MVYMVVVFVICSVLPSLVSIFVYPSHWLKVEVAAAQTVIHQGQLTKNYKENKRLRAGETERDSVSVCETEGEERDSVCEKRRNTEVETKEDVEKQTEANTTQHNFNSGKK